MNMQLGLPKVIRTLNIPALGGQTIQCEIVDEYFELERDDDE